MSPIDAIRDSLKAHPNVAYHVNGDTIEVPPADDEAFSVSLSSEPPRFTVTFDGGWHEQFDSAESAVNCFMFGLSAQCRLKIDLAGTHPFRWTVEHLDDGTWQVDSVTGLLLYPFWRRRSVAYRQNRLVQKST